MLDNPSARTRTATQAPGALAPAPQVRGLPDQQAVQALAQLRAAAADVLDWRRVDVDSLQALRTLDAAALRVLESMLAEFAALGAHVQAQDRRLVRPALELCAAFVQAFEHVVKLAREARGQLVRAPDVLVRLLRYRDIEMALTLCQYDSLQRARWRTLHDTYRLACELNLANTPVVVGQRAGGADVTVSAHEVYVRILLLEVAGAGQLLPSDIAATRRSLARWVEGLALQPADATSLADGPRGFWLNLDGMGGLTRNAPVPATGALWLDTTPLAGAIDAEVESLRESADPAAPRRHLLLSRIAPIYAPAPPVVKRRGERSENALAPAEVVTGGLEGLYRMLRDEARMRLDASTAAPPDPGVDEIVISAAGLPGEGSARGDDAGGESANGAAPAWQIRDASDSGCRLRGRAADLRMLLPGSLIAFREAKDAPWRLAVVRRLRKILGTNVELGVERLAVGPQRIVLTDPAAPRDPERGKRPRTIALYLPESAECPRIPIKTLVVPAHEFAPGRVMTMASTSRDIAIRMREPLESQADFVWTSFEFVDDAR